MWAQDEVSATSDQLDRATLRAVLDLLPHPAMLLDSRGELRHANPAAAQLLEREGWPLPDDHLADLTSFPLPDGESLLLLGATRHPLAAIALRLLAGPATAPESTLLEALGEELGWQQLRLWRASNDTALHLEHQWQDAEAPDPGGDGGLAEEARRTGGVVWDSHPVRVAFPLQVEDRLVAVVELSGPVGRPPDDLTATLQRLSQPLAGWLAQTRGDHLDRELVQRLRTAERRQRLLAEVSRVLASSLDEQRMLEQLTRLMVPTLADGCVVHLVDEAGTTTRVAAALTPQLTDRMAPYAGTRSPVTPSDREGIGKVLRTGLPLLYPRVTPALLQALARSPENLRVLRAANPTSGLVVPIPGRSRTLGAMTLFASDSGRTYGPDDLDLAEDVARRAGLAIAVIRLYERQRHIAEALQQSLLPPELPAIPGVELASAFRPGGEGVAVGGDFYDVFAVGESWVVGIGDVCGQGVEAAALTGRVRHSARALARETAGPAETLATVNRLLREEASFSSFCTALYAHLRPSSHGLEVTLARAGHPLPLLLRGDGSVDLLWSQGTLLGMFDDIAIEDRSLTLAPGDLLLLYTDGITEARHQGELFGEERLVEAVSDLGGADAASLVRALDARVLDFAGHRLTDDAALLALRPLPHP